MIEPIYKDDVFIVTQNDKFFISSIPSFPPYLRRVFLSNGEVYHSSMEEFEVYRDKFKAVLKSLEGETDEAFHITCLYFQTIERASFSLDIRNKMTPNELGTLLLFAYIRKKEEAIERIAYLIKNNNNLNYKEEEERDMLIYRYGLMETYKEQMTSGFTRLLDSMSKGLDELKQGLNENK